MNPLGGLAANAAWTVNTLLCAASRCTAEELECPAFRQGLNQLRAQMELLESVLRANEDEAS